jgi:hypothetical protein
MPSGDQHPSRRHPERIPRGEGQWRSLLTDDAVRSIRERYAAGGVSQYALAQEYGVTQTNISHVIRRKSWKHVA